MCLTVQCSMHALQQLGHYPFWHAAGVGADCIVDLKDNMVKFDLCAFVESSTLALTMHVLG